MVYADAGYQGIEKRPDLEGKRHRPIESPCAQGSDGLCPIHTRGDWMI